MCRVYVGLGGGDRGARTLVAGPPTTSSIQAAGLLPGSKRGACGVCRCAWVRGWGDVLPINIGAGAEGRAGGVTGVCSNDVRLQQHRSRRNNSARQPRSPPAGRPQSSGSGSHTRGPGGQRTRSAHPSAAAGARGRTQKWPGLAGGWCRPRRSLRARCSAAPALQWLPPVRPGLQGGVRGGGL